MIDRVHPGDHSSASPTTAVAPSTCRMRTVEPTANVSPLCWVRAVHSSAPIRIRPPEESTSRVTFAVRPMSVSTPSSCSGVRFVRCLRGDRPDERQQHPGHGDERDQLERGGAAEEGDGHPAERPTGEHEQDQVEADDLARREQARGDQPEQPRSHGGSLAEPAAVRGAPLTLCCRTDTRGDGPVAVVASAGARLPRRPVRGLGHGLAHRPHAPTTRPSTPCSATRAHRVAGLPGTDEAVPLGWALTALRGLGERRFRLVLPVPGDVRGLPAVPGLAALALESGQAAVGERLALVPEAIGPEAVAWTAFPLDGAPPVPPPVEGSLRAVSGALDLAVGDAARTLAALDLARWNPEVPTLLAGLAKTTAAPGLPPDHDPLALSVLGRAQRLAAVLDLAMADAPGAAVNHAQAAARDDALRPLAQAVREATTAAYNVVPRD